MLFSVAAGGIESSDEAKLQRVVATDRMMMKLTFGGPLEQGSARWSARQRGSAGTPRWLSGKC